LVDAEGGEGGEGMDDGRRTSADGCACGALWCEAKTPPSSNGSFPF